MNRPAQIWLTIPLSAILIFFFTTKPFSSMQNYPSLPTAWALPTATSMPQSDVFRFKTNFLDVLKFKSRLARSPTKNVTQVLLMAQNTVDTSTFTSIPTQVPIIITPAPDGIEVEETVSGSSTIPTRKCGIPSRKEATRQGRIVGGEVVHHGEFPWMVSHFPRRTFNSNRVFI